MHHRETPRKPLQLLVTELLHSQNSAYLVDEIEDSETLELVEEIRKAEHELSLLHARIARLRDLLVRVQSQGNR